MQLIGHVDVLTRSRVSGWVANKAAPHVPLAIAVHVNGERIGHAVADGLREDLIGTFPGSTGCHGFVYNFTPPLSMFVDQEISLLINDTILPSPRFAHKLAAVGQESLPLLVTSAGRSGSTLMMNRLHAHPEVVLMNHHPAEVKLLSYYAHALRILSSPADHERSTDPDLMATDPYHIGFNPYHDPLLYPHQLMDAYWGRTVPLTLSRNFRDLIIGYYDGVRMVQGKTSMRYLAEKTPPDPMVRQAATLMFGGFREIVLLRDPRDLVCSYNAFWTTPWDEARMLVRSQLSPILQLFKQHSPYHIFVKYENLTLKSGPAVREIFAFLRLDHVAEAEANDASVFQKHGTSKSPAASVGRWRDALPTEQISLCNKEFAEYLDLFGYGAHSP